MKRRSLKASELIKAAELGVSPRALLEAHLSREALAVCVSCSRPIAKAHGRWFHVDAFFRPTFRLCEHSESKARPEPKEKTDAMRVAVMAIENGGAI